MTIQSGSLKGAPFAEFIHCPRCGAASLSKHDGRAVRCADCDFKFYFNCATATAAFIFHQGKLLLGVRGKDPQQGMLDFPGGFVEFDETAEEALAREVQEELNIRVSSSTYLTSVPNDYWFSGVLYKTTDLYFVCEIEDISSIKAMDDVAGFLLTAPEDIEQRQLAFTSGRIALQRLLEYLKLPASR
jgi:ADP-ribose pyrophosphatase YjhB (NUDIX family)